MKEAGRHNDKSATTTDHSCKSPPPPEKKTENSSTPCRHVSQSATSHHWSLYEIRLRRKLERHNSTITSLSPSSSSSSSSSSSNDSVLSSINTLSPSCTTEHLKRQNACVPSASSPIGAKSFKVSTKSRMDSILESNLMSMHLNSALLSPTTTTASRTPCKSNPFEVDLLSTIHLPSFSPSVFSQISSPSKMDKEDNFHWSVDNLSAIYPADIPIPEHDNGHDGPDKETEEHVQKAINEFFSQHVMPSPWFEQSSSRRNKTRTKPFSPHFDDIEEGSAPGTCQNTPGGSKKHAWTQTTLSLPVSFDMQKVLASYYTFHQSQTRQDSEHRDNCNGDIDTNVVESSIPSLRRKLFVGDHEDSNATTCSDDEGRKPLKKCHLTPDKLPESSYDTDTPNLFSSSPITRRTSVVPSTYCSPPPLSPIETNKYQVRGSQTPNLAESMICSPHVHREHLEQSREKCRGGPFKENCDESGVFTPGLDNRNAVRFLLDTPKYVLLEPMAVDQSELKSVSFMDTSESQPGLTGISQDNGYLTGSLQYFNVDDVTSSGSSAGVTKVTKKLFEHECVPLIP